MSLNAGRAPHCRMRGRPWILPPEGLVIQSGSLLAAGAGRGCGRNAVKVHESATAQGIEVGTTAGHRLSRWQGLSAATRTAGLPSVPDS
jgi:hypothetical protein